MNVFANLPRLGVLPADALEKERMDRAGALVAVFPGVLIWALVPKLHAFPGLKRETWGTHLGS
jgi:hypothetical protein